MLRGFSKLSIEVPICRSALGFEPRRTAGNPSGAMFCNGLWSGVVVTKLASATRAILIRPTEHPRRFAKFEAANETPGIRHIRGPTSAWDGPLYRLTRSRGRNNLQRDRGSLAEPFNGPLQRVVRLHHVAWKASPTVGF